MFAKFNKVTSSADSTTGVAYTVDLSLPGIAFTTTAATLVMTYPDAQTDALKTLTFTVTGHTPAAGDWYITNDTAGEKLMNVKRLNDFLVDIIIGARQSKSKMWDLNQATLTEQCGLTYGNDTTTEPLVSIVLS